MLQILSLHGGMESIPPCKEISYFSDNAFLCIQNRSAAILNKQTSKQTNEQTLWLISSSCCSNWRANFSTAALAPLAASACAFASSTSCLTCCFAFSAAAFARCNCSICSPMSLTASWCFLRICAADASCCTLAASRSCLNLASSLSRFLAVSKARDFDTHTHTNNSKYWPTNRDCNGGYMI
jgi:hypothetical protein